MSQKKDISIIFIIQRERKLGYKDIDHYLPFLYFLSKSDDYNFKAKGFIFDSKSNYLKNIDPRVKMLSNLKNVELIFLRKDNFLDKAKQLLTSKGNSIFAKFFNRLISKLYNKLSEIKKINIDWKSELGHEFINSNIPLIFTLHQNTTCLEIVSYIKKHNIRAKWIALPHGTLLSDNQMTLENNLEKNEVPKHIEAYNQIDFSLKTSERDLEHGISYGLKKNKGIVIGSPRYCKEWLKIKSDLELDGKEFDINSKDKIRILFLVPKKQINIFSEELIRTIDFISSYQEFELILLNNNSYYPKLSKRIMNRPNIRNYLVSKDYSTSKLIDWSEIVFHVGTGVIFESFIKDKITVLPRYLSCNTLISDKYNAGINLSNRDELRAFCNTAVNSFNNLKKNYREKCELTNKKFIDDFVYANTTSVPQNIIKSISFISDSFKTL